MKSTNTRKADQESKHHTDKQKTCTHSWIFKQFCSHTREVSIQERLQCCLGLRYFLDSFPAPQTARTTANNKDRQNMLNIFVNLMKVNFSSNFHSCRIHELGYEKKWIQLLLWRYHGWWISTGQDPSLAPRKSWHDFSVISNVRTDVFFMVVESVQKSISSSCFRNSRKPPQPTPTLIW